MSPCSAAGAGRGWWSEAAAALEPVAPLLVLAPRDLVETNCPQAADAALAAWDHAPLALAFAPLDAEALERAPAAPRAALNLAAFTDRDGALEIEPLTEAPRLWTFALEIETDLGALADPALA